MENCALSHLVNVFFCKESCSSVKKKKIQIKNKEKENNRLVYNGSRKSADELNFLRKLETATDNNKMWTSTAAARAIHFRPVILNEPT